MRPRFSRQEEKESRDWRSEGGRTADEKDERKEEEVGRDGGSSFSVAIVVGSGGRDWGGGGGGWGGEGSLGGLEENGLNFHAVVADDDAREKDPTAKKR